MASRFSVGFARIEPSKRPIELFIAWRDEATKFRAGVVDACCLATVCSADTGNKVSSRNVMLREFNENGFVVITDARGKKVQDLESNPNAAMCFLWAYEDDRKRYVTRQVRIEGLMKKMEKPAYQQLYDREPLYCKIRAHLCHQDQPADLDDLNKKYNELMSQVQSGMDLPMPDHVVGYQLIPEMMEFYYAWDQLIADRVRYTRESHEEWKCERITA
ncbi:hypothetical protein DMN91_001446 [Ooceraea biroi]|uniref:pyridoxal 5'-phosphate synthase n=1 Tax=Ooceraea biroi TaxID=2015173 RepID=A0A026WDI5_OOCBI|nr:uncharacterized protein LOC105280334 [Ooceraea biroi]XP_019887556.1 uncharacterized protein LOC105280334 [Ooceraea biroi]EZA54102.1 Pyridoxine/pyridoxamine 5'-phosphate oxidase [Ooceraea biroi]RLU27642.1 hypothetical protein DMN91_001446 [Ooceraea biroi]